MRLIYGLAPAEIVFLILLTNCGWEPQHARDERRIALARSQIKSFIAALELYKDDTGVYPNSTDGLEALRTNLNQRPGWKGPYVRHVPIDPWGRPYIYRVVIGKPGEQVIIICYGRDGRPGGEDEDGDITHTASK
jgi:general secretion pathway protein G